MIGAFTGEIDSLRDAIEVEERKRQVGDQTGDPRCDAAELEEREPIEKTRFYTVGLLRLTVSSSS